MTEYKKSTMGSDLYAKFNQLNEKDQEAILNIMRGILVARENQDERAAKEIIASEKEDSHEDHGGTSR